MNVSICSLVTSLLLAQVVEPVPVSVNSAPASGCACGQGAPVSNPGRWHQGHGWARPTQRPVPSLFSRMCDRLYHLMDFAVPVHAYGCAQYGSTGVWTIPGQPMTSPIPPASPVAPALQPTMIIEEPVHSQISANEPPLASPPAAPPTGTPAPKVIDQSISVPTAKVLEQTSFASEVVEKELTGRLYRVQYEGQILWVLNHAQPGGDESQNSVMLSAHPALAHCQEGDLVTVRGQLVNDPQHQQRFNTPLYRVSNLQVVQRGQ